VRSRAGSSFLGGHVERERRLALRITLRRRTEAVRRERVFERAAAARGVRDDANRVIASARGRAIREQVEALRVRLDACRHLREGLFDLRRLVRELPAVAPDAAALAVLELGTDADGVDLEILVFRERHFLLQLFARDSSRA